jgi:hypothetical protein
MSEKEQKKTFKQVCECTNCGNEAEMVFTCSLEEVVEEEAQPKAETKPSTQKHKATGVCSHCGNEADMWIDI